MPENIARMKNNGNASFQQIWTWIFCVFVYGFCSLLVCENNIASNYESDTNLIQQLLNNCCTRTLLELINKTANVIFIGIIIWLCMCVCSVSSESISSIDSLCRPFKNKVLFLFLFSFAIHCMRFYCFDSLFSLAFSNVCIHHANSYASACLQCLY